MNFLSIRLFPCTLSKLYSMKTILQLKHIYQFMQNMENERKKRNQKSKSLGLVHDLLL